MNRLLNCINNKRSSDTPVWFMRQAGRYLPEFMEIRKQNTDFVKLCLNSDLAKEITIQPIKRFDLDAAIIFSDILMIPYGLGQNVNFKKGFGPQLDELKIDILTKINNETFTIDLLFNFFYCHINRFEFFSKFCIINLHYFLWTHVFQ